MSLTKLSLDGNYDDIYKLFLHRESLVSDIPAGDGNIEKLFLQCKHFFAVIFALLHKNTAHLEKNDSERGQDG